VWGVVGGTICAIGLVLVSPNMQYPLALRAEAEKVLAKAESDLARLDAPAPVDAAKAVAANTAVQAARAKVAELKAGPQTSIVGLSQPLVGLRNPGLISVPVGFLLVVLGSLLGRANADPQAWRQMRFRRYTGMGRAEATAH
jgi:cation/acetate symporter